MCEAAALGGPSDRAGSSDRCQPVPGIWFQLCGGADRPSLQTLNVIGADHVEQMVVLRRLARCFGGDAWDPLRTEEECVRIEAPQGL